MSKRTHFLFLLFLFFTVSVHAASIDKQDSTIPPILVKAKKKVADVLNDSSKTIISHEEISTSGTNTLSDALKNLGGIALQDASGNNSQVLLNIRCFGANANSNTLFLVNGIPLTNPDLAPPDLNVIPLQEIKYIEIISGSESVLYGDQAVGGIINVVTQEEAKEKALFSCQAGSYNNNSCSITLNHHAGRLAYNLALLRNQTDNYRNHNNYNQNALLGRFDYPYARGKLSLDYKLGREYMQYPGALTAMQVRENRRQATNNTDFFRDTNNFFHLHHQQNLNSNWQLETDFAHRQMQGNGVLFSPFTQSRMIHFIKPQLKGTIKKIKVITGVDLEKDQYQLNSAFGLTKESQEKYGAFGLFNIPLHSLFSLSVGARGAEQHGHLTSSTTSNKINRAFVTTLGVNYKISSTANIYLRRAGNFRFPKSDENASSTPNTGLKTQTGVSYETGIAQNNEKYASSLGVYQLNLQNEIAFDPTSTAQNPWGTNRNLDPTTRRGFTLSGKYKFTNQITVGSQYNFVNAQFQSGVNKGKRIPLVAENILHANLNYLFKPNWTIYSEAVLTGNQYAANDDANVSGKLGSYTVYNLNLKYHFKNIEASFRINNIFNKYYYLYTVYSTSTQSEFFYPASG